MRHGLLSDSPSRKTGRELKPSSEHSRLVAVQSYVPLSVGPQKRKSLNKGLLRGSCHAYPRTLTVTFQDIRGFKQSVDLCVPKFEVREADDAEYHFDIGCKFVGASPSAYVGIRITVGVCANGVSANCNPTEFI